MPFHIPPQQDPNALQQPGGPLSPPVSPGIPVGQPAAPQGPQQGFPGGMDRMNELYGLMAANAQNPSEIGRDYVGAVQRQQGLDRFTDPTEQMLRLYGNVNPYDFTADSLQKFEENRRATGQMEFGLLDRVEDMSTTEQKILNEYITSAGKSESDLARMGDIADRFDEMAKKGVPGGRVVGGLNEWMKGILGTENEVTRLRTEFRGIKNKVIIAGLPPGVASDKDIEIAMGTWPAETASPAYVASFLRGMQKLRAIDLARATHASAYMGRNRKQSGMLEDWNKNKEWMTRDIVQKFGGVYNPVGTNGKPMNAKDAAEARYRNMYSTSTVNVTPPRGRSQMAYPDTRSESKILGFGTDPLKMY